MIARIPSSEQWELFRLYQASPPPIAPLEFVQRWEVSYRELALLSGASRSTVNHWFAQGKCRRPVLLGYCRRLAEVDFLWRNGQDIPDWLLQRWSKGQ